MSFMIFIINFCEIVGNKVCMLSHGEGEMVKSLNIFAYLHKDQNINFITKLADLLQNTAAFLLLFEPTFYYKTRQSIYYILSRVYYKSRQLLQNQLFITILGTTLTLPNFVLVIHRHVIKCAVT